MTLGPTYKEWLSIRSGDREWRAGSGTEMRPFLIKAFCIGERDGVPEFAVEKREYEPTEEPCLRMIGTIPDKHIVYNPYVCDEDE